MCEFDPKTAKKEGHAFHGDHERIPVSTAAAAAAATAVKAPSIFSRGGVGDDGGDTATLFMRRGRSRSGHVRDSSSVGAGAGVEGGRETFAVDLETSRNSNSSSNHHSCAVSSRRRQGDTQSQHPRRSRPLEGNAGVLDDAFARGQQRSRQEQRGRDDPRSSLGFTQESATARGGVVYRLQRHHGRRRRVGGRDD